MIYEGEVSCPVCGGNLKLYDHVMRIIREKKGEKDHIYIRRMKCVDCGKIHRELPRYVLPYIQYDKDIVMGVLTGQITSDDLDYEDYSDPILFYEPNGRTYFEAPLEQVLMAEYYINRDMVLGMTVTLNDLYVWLGLDPTDYGETVGWTLMDEIYWIDFNHRKIHLEDGQSCYVIETPFGPSAEALSDEYY